MESTKSPLNPQTTKRIQDWLLTGDAFEFRKLLITLISLEELDSLEAFKKSEGDDGFRQEGFDHLDMAKKYEFVLAIMEAASDKDELGKPLDGRFPFITLQISQEKVAH